MTSRDKAADSRLRKLYGITLEQYDRILEYQGGCCAVCRRPAASVLTRLNVDHDHKTGVVRGLLCSWCNHKSLPTLHEQAANAARAAAYLIDPPAIRAIGTITSPPQPSRKRRRK